MGANSSFDGAIIGKSIPYLNFVYPLTERQQVYFTEKESEILLNKKDNGNILAAIYYIKKYEEYCVTPMKRKSFYLESGQPLGENRTYYLPRGTVVYLNDAKHSFCLA